MYISLAAKNSKTCGTRQRGGFPSGPRCQQKVLRQMRACRSIRHASSPPRCLQARRCGCEARFGRLPAIGAWGRCRGKRKAGATTQSGACCAGRLQAGAMASSGGGGGGAAAHAHTNRLSKEESPYLLQHAHNPVGCGVGGSECRLQAEGQRAWSCAAADVLVARLNHSVGLWGWGQVDWYPWGRGGHSSVRARRTSPSS